MLLEADSESKTGTPTDAPSVGPTMPPAFDLQEFARDSSSNRGFVLSPDTVLDLVPNVPWTSAHLDLVEQNVIRHIDGVSPLSLLETMAGISFDELQVMLAMLLARQLVVVVPFEARAESGAYIAAHARAEPSSMRAESSSGVFRCAPLLDIDTVPLTIARTG